VAGVSNSSPLLYLARLGDLNFLSRLFGHISIAEAVWRELVVEGKGRPGAAEVEQARGEWLSVDSVSNRESVAELTAQGLHPGEAGNDTVGESIKPAHYFHG
jgi:predicted nucleic acid-binding protein